MADQTPLSDDPELAQVVRAAFSQLLPEAGALEFSVREREVPDAALGGIRSHLVVTVAGASRPTVLGQFQPFSARQLRGYNLTYVIGYLDGWYQARHGRDLGREYELVLDTAEPPEGEGPGRCAVVPLRQALEDGFLDEGSPLAAAMRRHRLEHVLICGGVVSGPSVGLLETLEGVVSGLAPNTVLELFAGTCSLAQVAAAHGAREVVCVDSSIPTAVRERLSSLEGVRAEFVEADIASVDLRALPGEVIVADPFFDFTVEALDLLLAQLRGTDRVLVMNLGAVEPANWLGYIRGMLRESASGPVSFSEICGECIGIARL